MANSPVPPPPRAPAVFPSHPSDPELAKVLHSRVHSNSGMPLPSPSIVYEADVYAADPDELTERFTAVVAEDGTEAWYFFTEVLWKNPRGKRRKRTTGSGVWHGEGKPKAVVVGSQSQIGCCRNLFTFQRKGPDGKPGRTGWMMSEFRLQPEQGSLVLCKVQRSPRHKSPSSSVVAPNGTEASWAVEAAARSPRHKSPSSSVVAPNSTEASWVVKKAAAAAKRLLEKIQAMMPDNAGVEIETAHVTETAALEVAKETVATVERSIMAANKTVESVKEAMGVSLPQMVKAALASAKANASAMTVMAATEVADLTAALEVASDSAKATVLWVMAVENEDKVAVLMAAEAAAETAARAALVVVQAAEGQANKRKGKEALNVLVAAVAAAAEARNTVEATAFAVAAVAVLALTSAASVAMPRAIENYSDGDIVDTAPTTVAPETVVVASEKQSTGEATAAVPPAGVLPPLNDLSIGEMVAGGSTPADDSLFEWFMQLGSNYSQLEDTGCSIQPAPTDGPCHSSPAPPVQPCYSPAQFIISSVVPPQEEEMLERLFGNEETNDGTTTVAAAAAAETVVVAAATQSTSEATTATENEWNLHSMERFLSE